MRAFLKKILAVGLCTLIALPLSVAVFADSEQDPGDPSDTNVDPLPFVDVRPDRWYSDAVRFCYENRLMSGTSETTFSLSASVSRAMTVLIMAKIMEVDLTGYSGSDFTDVDPARWYSAAVKWAHDEGFAAGAGDGIFAPDRAVTRQELAVFFYKMACAMGKQGDPENYVDLSDRADYDELASWARTQFAYVITAGVMAGTTSKHISPLITVTRAQMAQFVYNYAADR